MNISINSSLTLYPSVEVNHLLKSVISFFIQSSLILLYSFLINVFTFLTSSTKHSINLFKVSLSTLALFPFLSKYVKKPILILFTTVSNWTHNISSIFCECLKYTFLSNFRGTLASDWSLTKGFSPLFFPNAGFTSFSFVWLSISFLLRISIVSNILLISILFSFIINSRSSLGIFCLASSMISLNALSILISWNIMYFLMNLNLFKLIVILYISFPLLLNKKSKGTFESYIHAMIIHIPK